MTVVSSDMREWVAPEKADIIVSELLGSFADNELSPECLDGAQNFLKGASRVWNGRGWVGKVRGTWLSSRVVEIHCLGGPCHLNSSLSTSVFMSAVRED